MLRITIDNEANPVRLKLEGRITGPWVAELHRAWQTLGPSLEGKQLCVDLCGVTYIDREGRRVLADMYRQTQAQFETDTPLADYFAEEARGSAKDENGKRRGESR